MNDNPSKWLFELAWFHSCHFGLFYMNYIKKLIKNLRLKNIQKFILYLYALCVIISYIFYFLQDSKNLIYTFKNVEYWYLVMILSAPIKF